AHEAKADKLRVREIPDALGQLRVLPLPGAVRTAPHVAATHPGLIIPGAAPHRMRIGLGRFVPGIDSAAIAGALFVIVRVILVEDPLHDIAVDVAKAPWVGLLLPDLLILEVTILLEPGVFAQLALVVAEEIWGRRAGARGVFPFGLGGQAVELSSLGAEPLAILVSRVL